MFFFTFDGIDGTGKSTQSRLFCEALRAAGFDVATCRDPGSTELGEKLRKLVVDGDQTPIGQRSETLIYMAARAQLVDEVIVPSLNAGRVVVSDRFLLANVVYQAYGLGLSASDVWSVGHFATGGVEPHLTFLLDLDVPTAMSRIARGKDRMESRGDDYYQRVREGFLSEAKMRPEQIVVVDARDSIESLHQQIWNRAWPLLQSHISVTQPHGHD
jgi:dTMP kinase